MITRRPPWWAMTNPNTPAGGQPANLPAGIPAIFNATAEAARLRQTITLAEWAIKIAADHRSKRHALGETMEETTARWTEAYEIEIAAKACRKAARSALRRLDLLGLVDHLDDQTYLLLGRDESIAESIAAAKAAALGLKAACDAGQEAAQRRQASIAARNCPETAARESGYLSAADKAADAMSGARSMLAAAPAARRPLGGGLVITPEQAATLLRLLRNPAAYALIGWEFEITPEEMAEHIAALDSSLRLLGSPDSFATLKRSHR